MQRIPVVAVMGHVDHGKTTLLDTIRGTRVAASEHGGITQNTRAHQITTKSGAKMTFIDTPGHEAFSAMRSRGAEVTDFVLLVVAADDGVQAQTKESIKFAKEAGVPIVVAINKIDAPGADIPKIKRELSSFGVLVEEFGGETLAFPVSALKNQGIEEMIEGIQLLIEVNGLKTSELAENILGEAYVMEAATDKRIGQVALCILKSGKLEGKTFGVYADKYFKVRTFLDQNQKPVTQVNAGDPFWATGLEQAVNTGEIIKFVADEKLAKSLASEFVPEASEQSAPVQDTEDDLLSLLISQRDAVRGGTEQKILNVVVKASTQGTLEAVVHELSKLGDAEKTVKVVESGTGDITEADIRRAAITKGIVISFQSKLDPKLDRLARQEKVVVRNYEIIYEMVDELSGALDGLIEPEDEEVEVARAKIKKVFTLSDGTIVAGCEVVKGTMLKGYPVYVERPKDSTEDEIAEVARGKIRVLKYLKEEVREIKKGQECGILIEPSPAGIEEGDEVVAYKVEKA